MNFIEDIKKSVKIIKRYKIPYALLYTTNIYPTPTLDTFRCIREFKKEFKNAVIGLSDHSKSTLLSWSNCYGASIEDLLIHFEKRFDISNSMDPKVLRALSRDSK